MKRKIDSWIGYAALIFALGQFATAHAVTIQGTNFSDTEKFSVSSLTLGAWDPALWTFGPGFKNADAILGDFAESISGADFTVTSILFANARWPGWQSANSTFSGGTVVIRGTYNGVEQDLLRGTFSSGQIVQDILNNSNSIANPTATNNVGFLDINAIITLNGGAIRGFFADNLLGFSGVFYKAGDKYDDLVAYGEGTFYGRPGSPPQPHEVPEPASLGLLSIGLAGMAARKKQR